MGKYKQVKEKFTVDDGLDTSEIESLRGEMQEWVDNMGGTALENTSRYQTAEEAVNTLEGVDNIRFDNIWDAVGNTKSLTVDGLKALEYEVIIFKVKGQRQHPSRAYRLSNAISAINGALECLREFLERWSDDEVGEIRAAIDEVESIVDELDGVEFPGMYG